MITIIPCEDRHIPALVTLMQEMTRFYGAIICPKMNVETQIREQTKIMDVLLALDENKLLGFTTFQTLFPVGGLLAFTHIQQIYVASDARRQGVARHLMVGIAKIAQARGCEWIEWATSATNSAARAFYDSLEPQSSEKIHYILKGDRLKEFALS